MEDMNVTQDKYCVEANLNEDKYDVDLKLLVCNDVVAQYTPNYHSIRYTILPICMCFFFGIWHLCVSLSVSVGMISDLNLCLFIVLGMLMSVFFLIITLIIYGCIPALQNLNSKCLLCYLATLAFGYTLLSGVQLNSSNYLQPLLCDSVGYLVYFTLFSAFLWLSVINFDLWLNFQYVFLRKKTKSIKSN